MKGNLSQEYTYYYNGHGVPRVTEVIEKMIHEPYIVQWANSLGFKHKRYTEELEKYAAIGTKTHHRIEQILHGDTIKEDDIIPIYSFYEWYKMVNDGSNSFEVVFTEKSLVCQYYGGTLDALLKINNDLILVDFKTSNYVTYKYFLQLSAYRKMLREALNININGILVLQLDKFTPSFEEYVMMFPQYLDYMNFCEQTFDKLVQGFVAIKECEQRYKQYILTR